MVESLDIRQSLSAAHEEHDDWLHNIFYIRCTYHAKVCDVIIDSGIYENVVVANMVEKLKFKTKAHPQP